VNTRGERAEIQGENVLNLSEAWKDTRISPTGNTTVVRRETSWTTHEGGVEMGGLGSRVKRVMLTPRPFEK